MALSSSVRRRRPHGSMERTPLRGCAPLDGAKTTKHIRGDKTRMGWSFRRSVNFGPFRLNASKSGLGSSFGVRGVRIPTGPRGTYVHMGAGGIYDRERIGAPARPRATVRDFKGFTAPEELITTADA